MRLYNWLHATRPKSRWRNEARQAMRRAIEPHCAEPYNADALIALVDAAYPFGERRYHPYKAWLDERRELLAILKPPPVLPMPTLDDFGACEVAMDLYALADEHERVGEIHQAKAKRDDALAMLIRQAPNRLNRACPVCGAKVGAPCSDAVSSAVAVFAPSQRPRMAKLIRTGRIVPHLSRVEPSANGPLFGGAP